MGAQARFIHESAERPPPRLLGGGEESNGEELKEGGRSLEGSFSEKNAPGGGLRADCGRTSPSGSSRTFGGRGITGGRPAGCVTARPGGRGTDNPRPGAPRGGAPRTDAGPDFQELEAMGADLDCGQLRALEMAGQRQKRQ